MPFAAVSGLFEKGRRWSRGVLLAREVNTLRWKWLRQQNDTGNRVPVPASRSPNFGGSYTTAEMLLLHRKSFRALKWRDRLSVLSSNPYFCHSLTPRGFPAVDLMDMCSRCAARGCTRIAADQLVGGKHPSSN